MPSDHRLHPTSILFALAGTLKAFLLPASWSANRTRPLCAYPKVARYNGTGDIESASSFSCK